MLRRDLRISFSNRLISKFPNNFCENLCFKSVRTCEKPFIHRKLLILLLDNVKTEYMLRGIFLMLVLPIAGLAKVMKGYYI